MKMINLSLVVLGAGVLLVVISLFWPRFTAEIFWDDQKAREHSQVSAKLHQLSHLRGHTAAHGNEHDGNPEGRSLEEAKQRYQRSRAMLHRARSYREGTARVLKWTGVLCSFLGAAGYFLLRSAGE
jgi:hypothetical protein